LSTVRSSLSLLRVSPLICRRGSITVFPSCDSDCKDLPRTVHPHIPCPAHTLTLDCVGQSGKPLRHTPGPVVPHTLSFTHHTTPAPARQPSLRPCSRSSRSMSISA
jgi:hypothetical protein